MALISWNMQGTNAPTENKWTVTVYPWLQKGDTHTICLQEAGSPPNSAELIDTVKFYGEEVNIYKWYGQFTVFHYKWDTGSNRVNLAIATKRQVATSYSNIIKLVYGGFPTEQRPALGVLVGNTWIFSFHAISGGGFNAEFVLNAISAESHPFSWRVGADFNREPHTLRNLESDVVVCPPNSPTYSTEDPKKKYDYFVCYEDVPEKNRGAERLSVNSSDHFPVKSKFS